MQLRFVVKQSRWPWIIGIWYHIGKSRQSIEILTYIMDVLHMFATAKTGDSHINRLQSIQCLIVSGLGGTVIVGGRCNIRIVRLAIRKIVITFSIFRRSLPNFSQTWAMFRCNTYVILSKLVGGHLLYCPVGTPNLVWISWKLKKCPRNIFCCSVLWAARSIQ